MDHGIQQIADQLHSEKFHNFYSSLNIIRMIKSRRLEMCRACKEEMRTANKILVGKTVGKRPLGKSKNR
jgi:hypothetical protein